MRFLKTGPIDFKIQNVDYSKTCVKGPLKKRQNKDLYDKW